MTSCERIRNIVGTKLKIGDAKTEKKSVKLSFEVKVEQQQQQISSCFICNKKKKLKQEI
jgi:hypothetical protein